MIQDLQKPANLESVRFAWNRAVSEGLNRTRVSVEELEFLAAREAELMSFRINNGGFTYACNWLIVNELKGA
jgi:hypothetical protein